MALRTTGSLTRICAPAPVCRSFPATLRLNAITSAALSAGPFARTELSFSPLSKCYGRTTRPRVMSPSKAPNSSTGPASTSRIRLAPSYSSTIPPLSSPSKIRTFATHNRSSATNAEPLLLPTFRATCPYSPKAPGIEPRNGMACNTAFVAISTSARAKTVFSAVSSELNPITKI